MQHQSHIPSLTPDHLTPGTLPLPHGTPPAEGRTLPVHQANPVHPSRGSTAPTARPACTGAACRRGDPLRYTRCTAPPWCAAVACCCACSSADSRTSACCAAGVLSRDELDVRGPTSYRVERSTIVLPAVRRGAHRDGRGEGWRVAGSHSQSVALWCTRALAQNFSLPPNPERENVLRLW